MVTETKNPTELGVLQEWTNPSYMLNAHDDSCSTASVVTQGQKKTTDVKTFGFAIPSNAIISKVYLGVHAYFRQVIPNTLGTVHFNMKTTKGVGATTGVPNETRNASASCTLYCADAKLDVTAIFITLCGMTPDDFNAENFTAWVDVINDAVLYGGAGVAYCDCCWITVIYTVPGGRQGDGFFQIGNIFKPNPHFKPNPFPLWKPNLGAPRKPFKACILSLVCRGN